MQESMPKHETAHGAVAGSGAAAPGTAGTGQTGTAATGRAAAATSHGPSGHGPTPHGPSGHCPDPAGQRARVPRQRSEEHTSELQSRGLLVCSLIVETKH